MHSKVVFHQISNTSKLVKKTRLSPRFSTPFSVFGYPTKHSSCMICYFNDIKELDYVCLNHWEDVAPDENETPFK